MKELTIEQKAQRYDEAIERAKGVIEQNPLMEYLKKGIEYIFPALKESEDEKIRKDIVAAVETYGDFTQGRKEEIYTWLEKQCEQKTAKVEPKFKVGDWVVYDHRPYQVVELPKEGYINLGLRRNGKIEFAPSPYCRHWTIKDANEGDILSYKNEIFIVKKSVNINILYYCCYDREHFIIDSFYSLTIDDIDNITPATKEQRDTLFAKMREAGYEWDAAKKELRKIKNISVWSEEDEKDFNTAIQHIENYVNNTPSSQRPEIWQHINFLKSFKDRVQHQTSWKPSEEMLEALYRVIPENTMEISEDEMLLDKLYQGLKYGKVLSKK